MQMTDYVVLPQHFSYISRVLATKCVSGPSSPVRPSVHQSSPSVRPSIRLPIPHASKGMRHRSHHCTVMPQCHSRALRGDRTKTDGMRRTTRRTMVCSAGATRACELSHADPATSCCHYYAPSTRSSRMDRPMSRHAHTCGHLWTLPRLIVIQGRVPKFVSSAGNYLGGAFLGSHHSGGSGHGPLTPYRSSEQAKKWLRKCLQLSAGKPVDTCGHSRG